MLLQPEGVEQSFVKAWFVNLQEEGTDTETLTIGYPEMNLVDGSEVIKVHAMGENGEEHLLPLPLPQQLPVNKSVAVLLKALL